MSGQLSLMRAHVPDAVTPVRSVKDQPLPGFDQPKVEPDDRPQGISPNTRAVCSDEQAKAGLARFLKRWHRFENVAKRVVRYIEAQGDSVDLRTVQNWLGARNLPDDEGRRILCKAYGPAVLRVIYEGADPDREVSL